jgi:signal transduction histidine kinase
VSDEIQRLADLVTEFLDFARPRPPQRRPTSARALCDRAMQLLAHKAEAAHVELVLDFPTRDPQLDVDPAKIEQVLLNLMVNGIEALPSRGDDGDGTQPRETVTLRVRRQPRPTRTPPSSTPSTPPNRRVPALASPSFTES